MTPLILHHYDFSNFSEKIRLIFGFKKLTWASVEIPSHLPKPDYTPLTLGYRRTPALQIGADIYCDTALIAQELEKRFPAPSLSNPNGDKNTPDAQSAARIHHTSECLASWAEGPLLWPAALYVTGLNAEQFPDSFHFDRAKLHNKPVPTLEEVKSAGLGYFTEMKSQLARIEALLGQNENYLLGSHPCLADFIVYGAPWLLETIGGRSPVIDELPKTRRWLSRIASVGHGDYSPMTSQAAIKTANDCSPTAQVGAEAPTGDLRIGELVKVSPRDEYSPAKGTLVAINKREIVISGRNERVNHIHVHFPRIGYRISRIKAPSVSSH